MTKLLRFTTPAGLSTALQGLLPAAAVPLGGLRAVAALVGRHPTLAAGGLALTIYAAFRAAAATQGLGWKNKTRFLVSDFIRGQSTHAPTDDLRKSFNEVPLIIQRPLEDHTHGVSAAHRSSATLTAEAIARNSGRVAWFHQRSRCDERAGRQGDRSFYWAKDLATTPVYAPPNSSNLLVFIDTDYYLDLEEQLLNDFLPTLVYTFQPDEAAATRSDYAYAFGTDGRVTYNTAGGATYVHSVWNYASDHITVRRCVFGVPVRSATYLVDKRRISEDHYLVMLTPVALQTTVLAALAASLLGSARLLRLDPIVNGFVRIRHMGKDLHTISTAGPDEFTATTIPVAVDEYLAHVNYLSKHDLSMPSVESAMGPHPEDKDEAHMRKLNSAVLTKFHRTMLPRKPDVIFPVSEGVRRYQYGRYDPDAKPLLVAFMSPLLHASYAPDRTLDNEEQAVRGRVINVRSDATPTPHVHRLIEEFVGFMVPIPHQLKPTSYDHVRDMQSSPSQRLILDTSETLYADSMRMAKSFMKSESYAKVADPRLITTINGTDKRQYSAYMYSVAAHLKQFAWYAFSRQPADIAAAVADVCSDAETVAKTDFTRLDGTISPTMRAVERAFLMRAFAPAFHDELSELHRSQYNLRGVTSSGAKYDGETIRSSGSPETTVFNSTDNAFAAYAAFRSERPNGVHLTPPQAWAKLQRSIFGGDDGLIRNLDVNNYRTVCASLGLRAKAENVERGQSGVMFLARVYGPDVWYGDANSCCDVIRQLSKLHTTKPLMPKVTCLDKLVAKARAYALSDANTPVIGDFCNKVVLFARNHVVHESAHLAAPYNARYEDTAQYPNAPSMWIDDYVAGLGLDLERLTAFLSAAQCLDDLLSPPLLAEPLPPQPLAEQFVLDGVTHHGDAPNPLPPRRKARKPRQPPAPPAAAAGPPSKSTARAAAYRQGKAAAAVPSAAPPAAGAAPTLDARNVKPLKRRTAKSGGH